MNKTRKTLDFVRGWMMILDIAEQGDQNMEFRMKLCSRLSTEPAHMLTAHMLFEMD